MTTAPDGTVEFSRPLRLDRLASGEVDVSHTASQRECQDLAARFGIPEVSALSGTLTVRRAAGGMMIRVDGRVDAEVTQTCVVTLERVANTVSQTFVQRYTLENDTEESEVFAGPDEEETPEPLTAGYLDLGEILAEELALALDPHPRAPGARFDGYSTDRDPEAPQSPFAVLAYLHRQS